jgi:hypothetical protein
MTFIIKLTSHRCSSSRTHYLLWYLMINLEPSSSHLVFQMSVMLLLSYYFFTLLLPSYLLVLSYYFFRPLYVTLHNNKYRGSELYIPSVCACVQFCLNRKATTSPGVGTIQNQPDIYLQFQNLDVGSLSVTEPVLYDPCTVLHITNSPFYQVTNLAFFQLLFLFLIKIS